jgi:hypothetical protein
VVSVAGDKAVEGVGLQAGEAGVTKPVRGLVFGREASELKLASVTRTHNAANGGGVAKSVVA